MRQQRETYREPLNKSSSAEQRIFSSIRAVSKVGNTYSIPPLLKPSSRAAPHNSARSLRQDFCSNSKFRKWRNTVCISGFRNCGSGAKRRLRLADAIVRCCPREKSLAASARRFHQSFPGKSHHSSARSAINLTSLTARAS